MEVHAGASFTRAYTNRTMVYLEWYHNRERARWIRRRRVEKLHGADNSYERCYECGEVWAPNTPSECTCEREPQLGPRHEVGTKRPRE